jgi:hypothetical protein
MPGMDWIAQKHGLFVHLPFAAALLLPVALIAAQRAGRGIKPWWVTCRYMAWAGVLGVTAAVLSGFGAAQLSKRLPAGIFLAKGSLADPTLFQLHQWGAAASLLLGLLTLRALHRKREDHQGIGVLGLFLGLLFTGATVAAGYLGTQLAHPPPQKPKPAEAKAAVVKPPDPEANAPLRALDYLRLVPMHGEPVRSSPHGNRWIRVWVSPEAESAYREGGPLPVGSQVVMSTMEDRWGRPSLDQGPLYALDTLPGGKTSLTFYWPRVPEARRNETRGLASAYWRGDDEHLKSCLACHAAGMAPVRERSKWAIPKVKSKSEAEN